MKPSFCVLSPLIFISGMHVSHSVNNSILSERFKSKIQPYSDGIRFIGGRFISEKPAELKVFL